MWRIIQKALLLSCFVPCATGFVFYSRSRRLSQCRLFSAVDGDAVSANRELWEKVPKALLHVGAKGVQPSHVRSLGELLAQHTVVKVKLSDHRVDSDKLASDLSAAENAKLAEIHPSKRYFLYVQAEPRAPVVKEPKADTRPTKTCRTCGEVGHISVDCPTKVVVPEPE